MLRSMYTIVSIFVWNHKLKFESGVWIKKTKCDQSWPVLYKYWNGRVILSFYSGTLQALKYKSILRKKFESRPQM